MNEPQVRRKPNHSMSGSVRLDVYEAEGGKGCFMLDYHLDSGTYVAIEGVEVVDDQMLMFVSLDDLDTFVQKAKALRTLKYPNL